MFTQVLGFLGMICIVLAYYKVTSPKGWSADSIKFNVVNLVGAVLLIISLCFHFNLGSFMIEIFWIIIAVRALCRQFKK